MARGRIPTGDEAILTGGPADPAPGLEGLPRTDLDRVEMAIPSFVEAALRSPLVLTRHGREAFVLLPLDVYRRLWAAAPRPPVIEGEAADARPAKGAETVDVEPVEGEEMADAAPPAKGGGNGG